MTYDPTDSEQEETLLSEKLREQQIKADEEAGDVRWLMSSVRGRRIVWRLLETSGVFRLSFSSDALAMAFAEGNRNFGNATLALIHAHCSNQYPKMVKENTNGS